jgi:hypothetical protein
MKTSDSVCSTREKPPRAAAGVEGPVGGLDKPRRFLRGANRSRARAPRALVADGLGRRLSHEPELGREYTHPVMAVAATAPRAVA